MKKLLTAILFLLGTGCALPLPAVAPQVGGGQQGALQAQTNVTLARANYRVVKTNVVGTDWGVYFLGVFPIVSPDYVKALKKLYKAGDVTAGKPLALANVIQQHTAPFFILFSVPEITLRADVVEFTQTPPHAAF